MFDDAPVPAGRRGKRGRVLAAWSLLVVTLAQVGGSTGSALGPVIAVTPDEVIPNGFVGSVYHPSISGRGEAIGIHDHEVREDAFVLLDVPGPDPMARGYGTAVSGDSCVSLWTRDSGSTDPNASVAFGIFNRCTGVERVIGTTSSNYDFPVRRLALSHTGRFAAVEFAPSFASEFEPSRVVRIDTETLEQRQLPVPAGFYGPNASLGLDISDDGNIVVTVVTPLSNPAQAVVAWDVAANQVSVVSSLPIVRGNVAAFPSVSGDGRFVSFVSTDSPTIVRPSGPWVYVRDRATGSVVRVSPLNERAYYSSISRDGTQVVYGTAAACFPDMTDLDAAENGCPTRRIDVAFSPVPGLSSAVSYDIISLNLAGVANTAVPHLEPDISGNGRWVTWIAYEGYDLVGTGDPGRFKGLRQAFVRRRDPGLTISPNPLDFGTIGSNTTFQLTATVTNTGRTSVVMDSISATPARFSIVGGGSCAQGASLPPGASCTVNVQFQAPGSATTVTGSLFVGETGFDPVQASARLIGQSSVTTTTSTTTTTVPGTTTTSTTVRGQFPVDTTTIPGAVLLDAQPSPVDFGQVAVGIAAPFQTVTVTNIGTASGVVATEMLGANPDDFFVNENLCSGATLAPGASCTISVTMVALLGGPRTAELTITSGGLGGSVTLQGVGRFAPRMVASPGAITERGFTTVFGQGFPPNEVFEVRIQDTSSVFPVTSDATGVFKLPLSALTLRLKLGDYVLVVAATSAFEEVRAAMVVVLPTFQPQGPGGPAFGNTLLVTRGG